MSKGINQVASVSSLSGPGLSGLGLAVAALGVIGFAIAAPARAQSTDNVNDVFDPNRNQTEVFGDNGLDINGLIDASRRLEQSQDQPWGLRDESVDEEVTRFRTAQDRRFGPEIFEEEPSAAPSEDTSGTPAVNDSVGVEDEAVTAPAASDLDSTQTESLDGEASEIAP
ncbi:MAG: hypothetical protein AAF974_07680 [Cyanobacteria bacterium P01_E01_bin.34]